ncbi:hypothetical protein SAMN04488498_104358 [Mesorhizobium albiziae]|uniref:Uncharacterized protein n=1 Tax=Neomesorhizobium albiziae TaxID=335020 RepID=A0A1I3YD54_9HYPH|nr:hypothetical protein [Mesorhizobium albiziae]GLS29936.1 hypothetical protein GCM10007937_16440 [Mesorhizobium albiziae]SFK29745.1 hypothetical protein SAMN04488498_104358 [Mesorhizobium albiziae]
MDALFNPPVFRYTVRTPETRHAALKKAAERVGMTPGELVQSLFDCLDLSRADGEVRIAREHFEKLFPRHETTRELAERAAACGLTVRELKVFRALAAAAGAIRIVRPSPMDITTRSGVAPAYLDTVYDKLLEKGFIAVSPSQGRGRRAFTIARIPEL